MIARGVEDEIPLRVVHVTQGLDVGGLEKLLVEFARHADRDRLDLRFVSLGTRGALANEIEGCGWPVAALEKPPGLRPGLVFRLARLLRGWRADVVHTHNNGPLIYAAPAARLARVPWIVHTRHEQNFGAKPRELIALRHAARLVNRFVCVSGDSAALSISQGIGPSKVRTFLNGVDLARFEYTGPRPDGPIVAVARLSPEKDLGCLLRAAALAIRDFPSLRLEIAGDGPCRPELERLVGELGLAGRARFLGEVRDVPAMLARASLFALSSLTEGIPVTLLEAMARGLPVVATRVGGNAEVVADGETGLLVPAQDPPALARALLRLLRDPEEAHRMGLSGRRRVTERFDVRRMVAEYESLYLEPRGRRPQRHGAPAGAGAGTAGRSPLR